MCTPCAPQLRRQPEKQPFHRLLLMLIIRLLIGSRPFLLRYTRWQRVLSLLIPAIRPYSIQVFRHATLAFRYPDHHTHEKSGSLRRRTCILHYVPPPSICRRLPAAVFPLPLPGLCLYRRDKDRSPAGSGPRSSCRYFPLL